MPVARTAPLQRGQSEQSISRPYFNDDVVGAAQLVQAGATLLYGYELHNVSAADAFLHLYNAAAAVDVTVGTAPAYIIPNAANAIKQRSFNAPLSFPNGLVIASATATDGSSDAAQDVSLDIS
jgi:hypothetical protein